MKKKGLFIFKSLTLLTILSCLEGCVDLTPNNSNKKRSSSDLRVDSISSIKKRDSKSKFWNWSNNRSVSSNGIRKENSTNKESTKEEISSKYYNPATKKVNLRKKNNKLFLRKSGSKRRVRRHH